jgi:hypothetical protein
VVGGSVMMEAEKDLEVGVTAAATKQREQE